jgi:hypothetical protein
MFLLKTSYVYKEQSIILKQGQFVKERLLILVNGMMRYSNLGEKYENNHCKCQWNSGRWP